MAVVTAFIIESYKNLQQQADDLTNHILVQLSIQISHLSINGNFVNSTTPDFNIPRFQKSGTVVIINTLWILSLLIALITASLCILIKQWFHELLSYQTHDPMERLKLRFFREAGVERWKVFAIASSLPLLLLLALLLFFVGLVLLLHQLDTIVASFTTGVVIIWLMCLLFMTLAPACSSQCPYKTPFLKGVISHIRARLILWPRALSLWFYHNTSQQRFPALNAWFNALRMQFWRREGIWKALEEECVCQNGSLSLPIISYARDLLQGEQLRDLIVDCISDISADDMEKTLMQIGERSSSMIRYILPNVSYGPAGVVGAFTLEVMQDDYLRSMYFGKEVNSSLFAILYLSLTHLQSEAYIPWRNYPISSRYLPSFIRLIQANPISAAFSFLIMYSIRHRTLTDHPDAFNCLFGDLSDSEKHSHDIGKLTVHSPF